MNSTLVQENSRYDQLTLSSIIDQFGDLNIDEPHSHDFSPSPYEDMYSSRLTPECALTESFAELSLLTHADEEPDTMMSDVISESPQASNQYRTPVYSEVNGRWYLSCGCNRNYVSKEAAIVCHSGRKYKSRKSGPVSCDFSDVTSMDF